MIEDPQTPNPPMIVLVELFQTLEINQGDMIWLCLSELGTDETVKGLGRFYYIESSYLLRKCYSTLTAIITINN